MGLWNIYLLSQLFIIIIEITGNKPCLELYCRCNRYKKEATCSFLPYIPKVPDFVSTLKLKNNLLMNITRETFRNVSTNNLTRLIFSRNNSMRTCSFDAFKDLKNLRKLEISNERNIDVVSLKTSFQNLNTSVIQDLRLENNGWNMLPTDFFSFLRGASLHIISLSYNKFIKLNTSLFRPFSKIERLYVQKNDIVFVNVDELLQLKSFDLSWNNIFEIPDFCDHKTGHTLVPQLVNLSLSDNAIRKLTPKSFRCLDKLQSLILDRNRFFALDNDVFSEIKSLKRLSIRFTPQLKKLRPRAFNSSSLQILEFVQNGFRFDNVKLFDFNQIFKYSPNLKKLDLTRNYLPNDPYILRQMFNPLKKIRTLSLQAAFLTTLPDGLFQKMPFLETLHLKGNKIERWNRSVFENLTSVRKLYLDANYIHVINESSFPYIFWMTLEKFDLSHNDFWCTCAQKWFLDFLRSTNITKILLNWPRLYACSYPEERKRLLLSKYSPTDAECTAWSPIFTIVITASSAVFLVFLIVIVMFQCQTNIRNCIYLFRVYSRKKQGYIRLNSSEDFEFDAFVVYCDADRQWVHNVLLKRMETIGLKVCVHYRDFDVGEPITDNIERYIEKSWKIIVIMSNSFTKSEWCQWEVDLVQERRRRHGKDALVLIMYRQIDSSHMTSSVASLLDTTPHLTYQEGFGEDLFWTAVMEGVKKSYTYPPTAIL